MKGNGIVEAVTFQLEAKKIEKLLYRIAWTYMGNNQDVEDVVQDALMKAWEKRNTLRNQSQFRPWLTQILVNQCKNALRKRKKISFFPLEEETIAIELSPEEMYVQDAVHYLKPDQRMVITLFYLDGFSVKDIADTVGSPIGTIKARLHAARKQLKKILQVEWEE